MLPPLSIWRQAQANEAVHDCTTRIWSGQGGLKQTWQRPTVERCDRPRPFTRTGRAWRTSLPFHLDAELPLPGVGVPVEALRVVDVAIECGSGAEVPGAAEAELPPVAGKVGGERDEAGRRGELGRRLAEELVPDVSRAARSEAWRTSGGGQCRDRRLAPPRGPSCVPAARRCGRPANPRRCTGHRPRRR